MPTRPAFHGAYLLDIGVAVALYSFNMVDTVSDYLSEKIGEYRILAAPLERASQEMAYAHSLLRARVETEIADHVPALGALADILEVSILDMLLAQDRSEFLRDAMSHAGLSTEDVMQQLRALSPPSSDELTALGLEQ
ncbi:MAG: hypothetical protein P4L33_06960 [Capsulimonadaceae bacterium]|nr:hypothetical protein [Capsulimonadaceae bacterium]